MDLPLWFLNLVFWSVQVALLILAAGFLPRVLQLRQPRVLVAYWRSLLAMSLLLPFVQPWHRPQNVAAIVVSSDFVPVPHPPPSTPVSAHGHPASLQTIASILGIVIIVGIAFRLAVFALGLVKLRRLRQASSPVASSAESGVVLQAVSALVAASAEFRLSAQVDSPVTFGLVAPVVLLPDRFTSLEPRFKSAIACHELLHVRRHDWAHHLGEEVLRALFWFHPAIAWLISRARLAREQVVDMEVVKLTNARKTYLEALLEFTNRRSSLATVPAPPFLAERQLVERVVLMLKEVRMSQRRLIASLTLISCCLILVLVLVTSTFPLKGAPRPVPPALRGMAQQSPVAAALLLHRIEVKHHDFDRTALNDTVVNEERASLNQLSGRLTIENAYDQTKAAAMTKSLEDFWSERGITVEVRTTLTPWPRSARYANLEFDVYKQTILPGRLEGGIAGGVAGGVSRGVSRGVEDGVADGPTDGIRGGVSGPVSNHPSLDEPSVDIATIWTETAKRGPMPLQVRGLGTLVRGEGSANFVAQVSVPASVSADLKSGQNATVALKNGPLGKGHVSSVGPVSNDTRTVDIALDSVPQGTTAGLEVEVNIDIGKLANVLYIGRPVNGRQNSETSLFKIINNGSEAVRTKVKLGRASANTVEILDGLKEGDVVILSDVSYLQSAERIRLTDEQHLRKH
jgi:beta-lactamase regulating signal transducer with metallopeptidase domain